MADLYYYETGYIDEKYFGYVADAVIEISPYIEEGYLDPGYYTDYSTQASLECTAQVVRGQEVNANGSWSSDATLSLTISKIASGTVSISAEFTQTAYGVRDRDIDLFAFSEASLSVQLQGIKENNISVSSAFDIATDGRRFRDLASAETSLFDLSIENSRSRATSLDAQAAFSLTASIDDRTKDAEISLTSSFTIVPNGGFSVSGSASLESKATLITSKYVGTSRPLNLTASSFNTSIKKYGNSSLSGLASTQYFTADKLLIPKQTEDFYFETWFYPTASTSSSFFIVYPFLQISFPNRYVKVQLLTQNLNNPNGVVSLYEMTTGVTYSLNNWHHIAVVKNNNYCTVYIDGNSVFVWGDGSQQFPFYPFGPITPGLGYVSANGSIVYVDEPVLYVGTTLDIDPQAGTITLPTSQRINDFSYTRFLYHFDGNGQDDTALTQIASAALSSIASISAKLSGPVKLSADLTSTSTLTATISHIEGADLSAFSNASLSVDGLRIKQLDSNVNSSADLTVNAQYTVSGQSSLASEFAQTTDNSRIRDNSITTESIATQISAVVRIAGLLADDLTQFNLTADTVIVRSAASDITSNISQSIDNIRIRFNESSFENSFALTSTPDVRITGASSISSEFNQSTSALRFRDFSSSESSNFTLTAIGNNLGKIEGSLFNNVSLTVDAVKTTESTSTLTSSATASADTLTSLVRTTGSDQSSAFSQTTVANKTARTAISLSALASELTLGVKTASSVINCQSLATMTVGAIKTSVVNLTITSTVNQTTVAKKTVRAASTQASQITVTAEGIFVTNSGANLSALAFEVTAAVKTTGISVEANASSTVAATGSVIRSASSSLSSTLSQSTTSTRIFSLSSNIQSAFTQTSTIGYLAVGSANISGAMTFVASVREIFIEEIVYVIPGEIWEFDIPEETREYTIGSETREYIIT